MLRALSCLTSLLVLGISLSLVVLRLASAAVTEPVAGSNESLLWGPYRPNLYFGIRPRVPKSLLAGLMWANVDQIGTVQSNFRHTCEQHEGMAGYGWDEYDIRHGGRQTIHDAENFLDLMIDFVKMPGSTKGGKWVAKVRGEPRSDAPVQPKTTVVFYAALEGLGNLRVANEQDDLGQEGTVTLHGHTADLGDFRMDIAPGPDTNEAPRHQHPSWESKPLDRTLVSSMQVPSDALWQAKMIMFTNMKNEVDGYMAEYGQENPPPPWQLFAVSNDIKEGNIHFVQKTFMGSFEFDIIFTDTESAEVLPQEISQAIEESSKSFNAKFMEIFAPKAPFTGAKFTKFSQAMLSNLVGGIGYFYGDSLVDRSYAPEYDEESEGFWEETAEVRSKAQVNREPPTELFTSVPSRSFFPRGFLWDEGFHLIPIADWDMDLTLKIVQSWFDLMDEDGWIGREQILGPEARSLVPQEFQVQYPHYANPPTLFLILDAFVEKLDTKAYDTAHATALKDHIRRFYPLLKRHYFWFRKTQWGDVKSYDREAFSTKEAYRWRGRTPRHILPSGLDDYPRPQPPHPGELHTDLISWMGMVARSLQRVAESLGEEEDALEFARHEEAIIRNIDDLHWSNSSNTFCDATIDEYEESIHVCHKGYISIFPFITGLLRADSSRLKAVLDLVSDPEELWSDYGIRSLSKTDGLYGTDENYWRSPIWMNINYLVVKNLLDIAQRSGPHREQARQIYTKLRQNLVENVYREWDKTGFAWEQYNPETGQGQRTQHFTGWTSLVVNIMAMPDLSGKGAPHDEL